MILKARLNRSIVRSVLHLYIVHVWLYYKRNIRRNDTTYKFSHRRSSLLLVGLSIAVFLTTCLLIVDGQGYYNPYPYNDPQAAFDQAGIARAFQNLYNSEYYNPYSYNKDPQAALDLMDIARANQRCTTMILEIGNIGPTYT